MPGTPRARLSHLLARLAVALAVSGAGRLALPFPPLAAPGAVQAAGVTTLAPSACPMAHCDAQLSNDENVTVPTATVTTAWTLTTTGMLGGAGLGCSLGGTLAVCTGTNAAKSLSYDVPYVYGLDPATGRQIWTSGTLLNGRAMRGAPLIDSAGNSYVSDDNSIVSFGVTGTVRWQVPNPGQSAVISFNLVSDGYLVGQGYNGPLLVLDPASGRLLGSLPLTDTIGGQSGAFATINTIAVLGNRVYVVTQFCPDPGCSSVTSPFTPGRLYAVKIVQGVPQVAWHWDFLGPSGGSPLALNNAGSPLIYLDGAGSLPSDPHHVWLFAVNDQGATAALKWSVDLTALYGVQYFSGVQASPAHDPRGGIWVWASGDRRFFEFAQGTGALAQVVNLGNFFPQGWYVPSSALSIAVNGGHPVLFAGVVDAQHTLPSALVAIDLLANRLLWQVTTGMTTTAYTGQFPLASTRAGMMLVAVRSDTTAINGYLLR